MPDHTFTTEAGDRLTPGTVITFTEDLTRMSPRWRHRVPGAHLVITGYSPDGYCLRVLNTFTGHHDAITVESWWTKAIQVVGRLDETPPEVEEREELAMSRSTSRGLRSAQWRVLNRLHQNAPGPSQRASVLLDGQDATDGDMVALYQAGLVTATFVGDTAKVDLTEHLAHYGSTFVIWLHLTRVGVRLVRDDPRNRVSCHLAGLRGHRACLASVMTHAAADMWTVQAMCGGCLVVVTRKADGTPVDGDLLVANLPPRTLHVQLTAKGRQYLPLPL